MRMLAVYSAGTVGSARRARDGEPCVSNFRVCGQNMFLGLETDGLAACATPAEIPDQRIEYLFGEYRKRYPSLPESVLSEYFVASGQAASGFKNGEQVRVEHLVGDMTRFYSPENPEKNLEVRLE